MYDFDGLFSGYIKRKGHVHEDELDEVYSMWLDSFDENLGDTPRGVLEKMSDEMLIKELKDECLLSSPSLTVMENLEKRAPVELLKALLYEDDGTLVYCAAELLYNLNKVPYETFANMLGTAEDKDLFELIVSALKEQPDLVREILIEQAENADIELKTVIAEILCEGSKDERVYKLLSELFASGENIPLYANLFSRYGDERAVAMLYRALDTASYADYIEIRNAIEALGGIVDEERDFSVDPQFISIKEKSNGH